MAASEIIEVIDLDEPTNLDSELSRQSSKDDTSETETITLDPTFEAELQNLDNNFTLVTNDVTAIEFTPAETDDKTKPGIKCFACNFHTLSLDEFKTHIREEHPDVQSFSCMNCTYQTKKSKSYYGHLLRYVDSEMHQCSLCSYSSKYKSTLLLQHMKVHEQTRYKCDLCDFTTIYDRALLRHTTQHDKVLLKCDHCSYHTAYRNRIVKHLRTHVNTDVNLKHQCHLCQFNAKYRSILIKHMVTHMTDGKLECEICGYITPYARNFNRHRDHHKIDSNNFMCRFCSFTTKDKHDLKLHFTTHHDNKKIKCNHCDFVTFFQSTLKHHLLKHD